MKTMEDQAHRVAIRCFDTHAPLPEVAPTEARHVAGQAAMRDPRAAQLLALFEMSDERGRVTLLAFAGIHAARYPNKEKA
jgi:hypothetical protein